MKNVLLKLFSIISIVLVFLQFSCAKNQQSELKQFTIASGICNLLVEKKYEAAYSRIDDNFKVINSLEDFSENAANFIGKSELIKKIKYKNITENNTYLSFDCDITTDKGTKKCNFVFSKNATLPINLNFSQSKKNKKTQLKKVKNDIYESEDFDLTKALSEPSLKDLCSDYFKLGFGIYGYNKQTNSINLPEYMEVGKKHFNSCTLTNLMKPVYILNEKKSRNNIKKGNDEPALNFNIIEDTLKWCQENNVQMRGHTLVWHTQTPLWFFCEDYDSTENYVSRDVMIKRLDSFTKQYMDYVQTNFPGVVYCWDVVNEAVDPAKGDSSTDFLCRIENDNTDNYWYYTIGNDYPEVAFTIARKYAADGVKLFYNDYGTVDKRKRELIYNLCKSLKDKGLIDGVGMQGYWDVKNPSLAEIKNAIELYASLGIEIQLTEWSIPAKEESERGFNEQAERYASVFRLLKHLDTNGGGNANITCVSFFGVMDGYTLYGNDKTNSRLFDKLLQPKPVFYSIRDTFETWYGF